MPGWWSSGAESYAYHGDDGLLYSSRFRDRKMLGQGSRPYETGRGGDRHYGTGSVIGCGLDVKEECIFFTLNGEYLGQAFNNIRGRWFPAIGILTSARVSVSFGAKPFVYPHAFDDIN